MTLAPAASALRPSTATRAAAVGAHLLAGVCLLAIAYALRRWFFCGFILGDDMQEFAVLQRVLGHAVELEDQLQLRFGWWLPNAVTLRLFGVNETGFMMAQWLTSSALALVAYALLVAWGYGIVGAFLGGLFVASAPFEVLIGTARVNDLYLEAALAFSLLLFVRLQRRPVMQGTAVALCLWYAFYVKLWAVYALPALAWWYRGIADRVARRRGVGAFVAASAVLHGATCAYWKARLDTWVPFVHSHAANWAVSRAEFPRMLRLYPDMILRGSEFGTTLFGAVPYLLLALFVAKTVGTVRRSTRFGLDRADGMLAVLWGSFLVLLELFPNGFSASTYYSVPRIFRYLAPISFPMALHVAKMLLDVARLPRLAAVSPLATLAVMAPFLAVNLRQVDEATRPGQQYHAAFTAVLDTVRRERPPALVADALIASWIQGFYAPTWRHHVNVKILHQTYASTQYEDWLRTREQTLPEGTLLLTGLAGYVHYGAHAEGMRLRFFRAPLGPNWRLVHEFGVLSYEPWPEPVRLWRLERRGAP